MGFATKVAVTGQHRGLLDQALEVFGIAADHDLNVMQPGQTLSQSTSRILAALEPVLLSERPDMVMVQGDTTTTFCGALAAFYQNIAVGHVEAGLRTWDLREPFPEEMNRVLVDGPTTLALPDGTYDFYTSRGPFSTLGAVRGVKVDASTGQSVDLTVDTLDLQPAGSLTGDFHVHGGRSFDSNIQIGRAHV